MTDKNQESAIAATAHILKNYGFESPTYSYDRKIDEWLKSYPFSWIRLALTESLYQGRYKIVSLERILLMWKRKGEPSFHFNREFERLVLNKIPHNLNAPKAKSAADHTSFAHSEFLSHRRYSRSLQPLWVEESLAPKGSREQHLESPPIDAVQIESSRIESSHIEPSHVKSSPSQRSQTHLPAIDDQGEDLLKPLSEGPSFSDAESSFVEHSPFDSQIEAWLDETQSLAFDPVFPLRRKLPLTVEELSDFDQTGLDEADFEDAQADLSPSMAEEDDIHDDAHVVQSHSVQSGIGLNQPIGQFSPKPKSSGFYSKLTAIAHPNL